MYQWLSIGPLAPLLLVGVGACEASRVDAEGAKASQQPVLIRQVADTPAGKNVTDKQAPISQRFRTLDDYLAFLERTQAPVDGPWYKQVRAGVYELQTGNLRLDGGEHEAKRTFTREELEREFGFAK